jgi:methionine-rich copper-binding protein CopC
MAQRSCAAVLAMLLLFGLAGPVLAHANLVKCSISNGEVFKVGHTPRSITGTFAEVVNPKGSWMDVFEGQADHGLVSEGAKYRARVNFKNPHQMTMNLPKLRKEQYYLIWYTTSAVDGHVAAGIVYFAVR